MKKFAVPFLSILILLFIISPSWASEEKTKKIRVQLNTSQTKNEFSIAEGSYQITDMVTSFPLAVLNKGDKITVYKEGLNLVIMKDGDLIHKTTGPMSLLPVNEAELNLIKYLNVRYQDGFTITTDSQGFLVVNNLSIENYLYGVIGREIGSWVPEEALKAQAIVSRTYALNKIGSNTRFDVYNSTASQVYMGYEDILGSSGKKIERAVQETSGLVVYYDNKLIDAVFHSNAGGYTEDSENIWSNEVAYLRAVPSADDSYAEEYNAQSANGWPANTYSWEKKITYSELVKLVQEWNKKYPSNGINIGDITDLKISKKAKNSDKETKSGRVTELTLVGTKGSKTIYRDSIRSFLGTKSTLFDLTFLNSSREQEIIAMNSAGKKTNIDSNSKVIGANSKTEKVKTVNILGKNSSQNSKNTSFDILIRGNGYGHGLGMSQWGAIGMATNGDDYEDIIFHYYGQNNKGKLKILNIDEGF